MALDLPTVTCEVAFTTAPGSTPTWTDVSSYLTAFTIRRGRQHELARPQAGTAEMTFKNDDRRFDPDYASSAYYPNVLPMRRVRIRATWSGTTYDLFHGFIEAWPQLWPSKVNTAFAQIRAVDGFKVLNLNKITASYSSELAGTRVANVLNSAGWPAADRDIDAGVTTLQASTLTAASPLDHLLDVADTEQGLVFINGAGQFVFQDRDAGFAATLDTANDTWGDSTGENPYQDITVAYDESFLWNDVRLTRNGGIEQTATDATSQTAYLTRTLSKSTLHNSDTDVDEAADYLVNAYKDPQLRITSLKVLGARDSGAKWSRILRRELGDKIRVRRRPPGGGSAIEQDSFIEGMEISARPDSWVTTWQLAPIDRVLQAWVLGSTTDSVLGTTTRLSY